MKLTPPKTITFGIALLLGLIAVILQLVPDWGFQQYTFPLAIAGLFLLALGNLMKDL